MPRRPSRSTLAVLKVLVDAHGEPVYGLDIARRADLASGTLYPILDRLSRDGLLEGSWEDCDPSEAGRPRRRYYRLTAEGEVFAVQALQVSRERTMPRAWVAPIPAGQGRP